MSAFEELGIMEEIIRAIAELEWTLPTPIQQECIPLILGGGDMMAAAETGSGKTGAFALPALQIVWETLRRQQAKAVAAAASSASANASSSSNAPRSSTTPVVRMSDEDRDVAFAIAADGLLCQAREAKWQGARANYGVLGGQAYYECEMTDDGLCRIGWSTANARLDLGTCAFGFGYGGTGKRSNNRQFVTYGEPFSHGDIVGCYIDRQSGAIGFTKNGKELGTAFTLPAQLRNKPLFPAAVVKNAELRFNFGATPFKFAPPSQQYKPIGELDEQHVEASLAGFARDGAGSSTTAAASSSGGPLALILEPVRDLALQTHEAMESFAKYMPEPRPRCALLVGGVDRKAAVKRVQGGVDIVTATPGRLIDLVKSGELALNRVRFFILDEADQLNADNHDILLDVYGRLTRTNLQVLLFSATLHAIGIQRLADKITHFPIWVDLKGKDAVPDTVDNVFINIDVRSDKSWKNPTHQIKSDDVHTNLKGLNELQSDDAVSEATKRLKAQVLVRFLDANDIDQALIFVRTRLDADNLAAFLCRFNDNKQLGAKFSCCVLHSGRQVAERNANLAKFKDGDVKFLICTDVAARGIDVHGLPFMINYTLPDTAEDFIHRIGRVGRADRAGLAVSLVSAHRERVWYHTCKSRGKSCENRSLREHGGCTIWYDEPDYWRLIQQRLGETVAQLDEPLRIADNAVLAAQTYGEKRGKAAEFESTKQHLEELREQVATLATLELDVQRSFWSLRNAIH